VNSSVRSIDFGNIGRNSVGVQPIAVTMRAMLPTIMLMLTDCHGRISVEI